jgi:hypothetical protein
MQLDPSRNFVSCTLATSVSALAGTLQLLSGQGAKLPVPSSEGAFNLVVFDSVTYADPPSDPSMEIVRCTSISGDVLTILRGQEGTTAASHPVGGAVKLHVSKKLLDDIRINTPGAFRTAGLYGGGNGCLYLVGSDDSNPGLNVASTNTGQLYAIPTIELAGRQIDRVAFTKTGLGAYSAHVGIYSDNGSLYPGVLLADLGAATLGGSKAGWDYYSGAPLPLTFPTTGVYWYASKFAGIYSLWMMIADGRILGYTGISKICGLTSGSVYAAGMPSVFGAGASLVVATTYVPAMFRRYSIA